MARGTAQRGILDFRRALLDDPTFHGADACIFSCNAAPTTMTAGGDVSAPTYFRECAGRAFAERYERRLGTDAKDSEESSSDDEADARGEQYGKSKNEKTAQTGGCLKLADVLKGINLYELLCVSEGASQDEVKKAYRSLCLTAHPDKVATESEEQAKNVQERFVQIQESYEVLSDPAKRMQYDSSLDFDDSLPKYKGGSEETFCQVFGEVFRRNARFSVRRPVPDIGGPETPADVYKKFYDFWHSFQSWRDPLMLAQKDGEELHDLADAECREEKRWMMKENARMAKSYKRAECERIADLTNLAEKWDPRILADKAAKKEAREADAARKAAEKAAIQKAKDETERKKREEEERLAAIEAEKRREEKAARDAIKERLKKCRQRVRGLQSQVNQFVSLEQLNAVCLALEEEKLTQLGKDFDKAIKKGEDKAASVFHKAIASIGLTPIYEVKAEEESISTASGDDSSDVDPEVLEERRRLQEEREARRKEQEARDAEVRAKEAEQRAIERAKRDEAKKKADALAEQKKVQLERKEREKAKKAEEKKAKDEEKEAIRRQQQAEETRIQAQKQAEKDKGAAEERLKEMESEKVQGMFANDRIEKLTRLDALKDEEILAALAQAITDDATLRSALHIIQDQPKSEDATDRAMAVLYKAAPIHPPTFWPLGLMPPAMIRLPNNVRNRVKKGRQRLRDLIAGYLSRETIAADDSATEWQRGVIAGTVEIPAWTPEEREAELKAAEAAQAGLEAAGDPQALLAKKKKAKKDAKATQGDEENLDDLLAEFGVTVQDKKKKKKKP